MQNMSYKNTYWRNKNITTRARQQTQPFSCKWEKTMEETWIKLYRKIMKSPIWENEKALKLWIWCLLKATHEEREQLVGQQLIHLNAGEFIFGRKKASEEIQMNENTIYKYLKLLEKIRNDNNKK